MFSHCARWERLAGARGKWITHLTLLISIRHKTYAHRTKAYTHKRALCEQSNHSMQQESQTQNWTITTKHCYPFNVCVHQNQFRVPSVCVFRTAKRGIVLRNVCVCVWEEGYGVCVYVLWIGKMREHAPRFCARPGAHPDMFFALSGVSMPQQKSASAKHKHWWWVMLDRWMYSTRMSAPIGLLRRGG